jgi:cytochrome bd ubiquinol oxidase subunit II
MTLPGVLIAVLWAALTVYAVLGGADFGAGVLHVLAPAGRRGRRRRQAIAAAMGPVWEANHVWLVFFLTGLLTLFPGAFSALGAAVLVPGTLVLLGLVVRGAALAFAGQLTGFDRARRPLHAAFGVASAATPLVLGATAAGLARQRLVVDGTTVRSGGGAALWLGPFQVEVGLLAVAACAALAAAFLTVEMGRAGDDGLAAAFRGAAAWATAAMALLAFGGLALAALDAPVLFRGLTGRGLPAVLAVLGALGVALGAVAGARDRLARAALVAAMAALVWGWGLAQYPRLVGRHVTVASAAAAPAELHVLAIALGAGAVLLLPALWLLYGAFRRRPTEVPR